MCTYTHASAAHTHAKKLTNEEEERGECEEEVGGKGGEKGIGEGGE